MHRVVRGPIVTSHADRTATYMPDGALADDGNGRIGFVGRWEDFVNRFGEDADHTHTPHLMLPLMWDLHTHIPQHPIRGHFADHVSPTDPRGRLLAGLETNVYPAEIRYAEAEQADAVTRQFIDDTRRHGVIGGCAFLTSSPAAARRALELLPETWHAGVVLMDQNCPGALISPADAEREMESLAQTFGRRFIVTDRFAVATTSALRRRGAGIARRHGLMAQTHLNEQAAEKTLVETTLYPAAKSYTHVYLDDGLLDSPCIVAHCIHMTEPEWRVLADRKCVVAHCPTSNAYLESGTMPLDDLMRHGLDYAICTDVGASPTVSLLAEMGVFLRVHAGRSAHATPAEALYRTTLGPARILGVDQDEGSLEPGKRFDWFEAGLPVGATADEVLRHAMTQAAALAITGPQR